MTTKEQIVELLLRNPKAVGRALVVLNERQTRTEQAAEHTINRNGEGFTPADAHMGTSMAKFFARNGYLTERQLAYWMKPNVRGVPRICKYAGQLVEIANAKAAAMTQTLADRIAEKDAFAREEAVQEQQAFIQKLKDRS